MSDFGLTPEGFKRKRLADILPELQDDMRSVFGDNFNVSDQSPDGQILGTTAEVYANLWEIADEAYNAFNPSSAQDSTLSNLVQINGIVRRPASPSTVSLTVTGNNGTVIPAGSLVSTVDGNVQFSTDAAVTISAGTGTVAATATVNGPLVAEINTVTVIDTPISGWATVTNPAAATLGSNAEEDAELRARRDRSVAINAQSVIDAIFATINAVQGVTQLTVIENDTNDNPDPNGLPAHSFNAVVVGGTDEDVAQAIFLKKPVGILAFGSTTIQVPDDQGINHPISFTRPNLVNIFVNVTIKKSNEYPSNGDEAMKQAIVDYANGELIEGRGFFLGDDVIYSRLYTPINVIPGHEVTDLRIGKTASPTGTSNIAIAFNEVSTFLVANINIIEAP